MRNDGIEVQAKVCGECGQLVLTYRRSMKCIICGGMLRQSERATEPVLD